MYILRKNQKPDIIKCLNRFWLARGINFGEIIWRIKPKTKNEWGEYLVSKKFFLVKNMGYWFDTKPEDNKTWIRYLVDSFWNLYSSEKEAINFIVSKGWVDKPENIVRTNFEDDKKYGVDFAFTNNGKRVFLIVKHKKVNFAKMLQYKPLEAFEVVGEGRLYDGLTCTILLYCEGKVWEYVRYRNTFKEFNGFDESGRLFNE